MAHAVCSKHIYEMFNLCILVGYYQLVLATKGYISLKILM